MAKLDATQTRAMARLLREHLETIRALVGARALLQFSEQQGTCPTHWKETLEDMKATPQYNAIAPELESLIVHLEKAAEEIDLNELFEKLPKENPIH